MIRGFIVVVRSWASYILFNVTLELLNSGSKFVFSKPRAYRLTNTLRLIFATLIALNIEPIDLLITVDNGTLPRDRIAIFSSLIGYVLLALLYSIKGRLRRRH